MIFGAIKTHLLFSCLFGEAARCCEINGFHLTSFIFSNKQNTSIGTLRKNHTHIHTHVHTHTRTCMRTRTHTRTHARTHDARTHAHTHTHTQICPRSSKRTHKHPPPKNTPLPVLQFISFYSSRSDSQQLLLSVSLRLF